MSQLAQVIQILFQTLPVVLGHLQHEAALVLDSAEPVPDGDRPHAVVRYLDGLDAQPELAALVALVLVVRDGPVGDGDAVDAARHFAVVVEPGRGAGVGFFVYCVLKLCFLR